MANIYNLNGDTGGMLYIYDLNGDTIAIEDLSDKCMNDEASSLGCIPSARPHMVRPNKSTLPHKYVIIPFFDKESGINIGNVNTRKLVSCFNTNDYGPGLVHDAIWASDDSYIIAIDLAGFLHKFSANIETETFAYINTFDISVYAEELGTEVVKPISAEITSNGLVYVTMSKGG
jgi:hypothetical protein